MSPKKCMSVLLSSRMTLAMLCATGLMELFMSRTNLSIVIVEMVQIVTSQDAAEDSVPKEPFCLQTPLDDANNTFTSTVTSERQFLDFTSPMSIPTNKSSSVYGEEDVKEESSVLKLTTTQRGNVLSAFFYAYGISGIFGGRLADVYGTKRVFGIAVLVDGVGNLLIPIASKTNYWLLFFMRFTMGLFQGTCYPSLHSLLSRWIPPQEMTRFVGFVYFANSFGTIFSLTTSGFIISGLGWEYVFYISGSISFLWLLSWIFLMYDTPEGHPRISQEEREYILRSMAKTRNTSDKKHQKIPWLKMFTSMPVWAINAAHAASMFGLNFFVAELPIYMSSIVGVNMKSNGFLSSLPFLARFLGSNILSWLFNFLAKRIHLHPKTWKIIITVVGFGGTAVPLLLVGYMRCRVTAVLWLFILGMALNGSAAAGYMCNHLDIIPNFAGTVFGFSNTVSFLYVMVGPVIAGALTPNETMDEWIKVYWVIFFNYVVGGTIYCMFLSTDVQPWNEEGLTDSGKIKPRSGSHQEQRDELLEEIKQSGPERKDPVEIADIL